MAGYGGRPRFPYRNRSARTWQLTDRSRPPDEVIGDAVLLEMQLKRYADQSHMNKAEFNTVEEAEAWLDSEE